MNIDKVRAKTGPRGGKLLGKTKTGKPVYEQLHGRDYPDFSAKDHKDAAQLHEDSYYKTRGSKRDNHYKAKDSHDVEAYIIKNRSKQKTN